MYVWPINIIENIRGKEGGVFSYHFLVEVLTHETTVSITLQRWGETSWGPFASVSVCRSVNRGNISISKLTFAFCGYYPACIRR